MLDNAQFNLQLDIAQYKYFVMNMLWCFRKLGKATAADAGAGAGGEGDSGDQLHQGPRKSHRPHRQDDGQVLRRQGGHLLQHDLRRQERRAHQRVQTEIPRPRQTSHGPQTVPPPA